MTSPLRSRLGWRLRSERRSRFSGVREFLVVGDALPVGVLVAEGVSLGWEKRPKSELTRGAAEGGA
jgi:hypothetical protein